MNTLPANAIREFQSIYRKRVGVELSFDKAGIKAENFLRLMMLVTNRLNDKNGKCIRDNIEKI